jgi:hypothetical protein
MQRAAAVVILAACPMLKRSRRAIARHAVAAIEDAYALGRYEAAYSECHTSERDTDVHAEHPDTRGAFTTLRLGARAAGAASALYSPIAHA